MQLKLVLLVLAVATAVQGEGLRRWVKKPTGGFALNATTSLGIYDGKSTTIKQHPWLCVLNYDGTLFGTGTIVSKRWIVLGAELSTVGVDGVTVIAGSTDGQTGKQYTLTQIIAHPKYDGAFDYDYACAQIKGSFKWSAKIKPIKLATKQPKGKTPMVVAGYGSTSASGKQSNGALYQGTMYWLAPKTCQADFEQFSITWTNRMACAYNQGKTTCCDGDWYAPFVYKKLFYGYVIGMVESTWCSSDATPDLLANIPTVASWIKKTTKAKTEDD